MQVILGLGILWTLYGIAGIAGFQVIDEAYKHRDWTTDYIRMRGISWLMLGLPMLLLYLLVSGRDLNRLVMCLLILLCGTPSLIYTVVKERAYKRLLREEADC